MTAAIAPPQTPTFGAVCARCNDEFVTRVWKAPFNTLCAFCLTGQLRADDTFSIDDAAIAAWGAGS